MIRAELLRNHAGLWLRKGLHHRGGHSQLKIVAELGLGEPELSAMPTSISRNGQLQSDDS